MERRGPALPRSETVAMRKKKLQKIARQNGMAGSDSQNFSGEKFSQKTDQIRMVFHLWQLVLDLIYIVMTRYKP